MKTVGKFVIAPTRDNGRPAFVVEEVVANDRGFWAWMYQKNGGEWTVGFTPTRLAKYDINWDSSKPEVSCSFADILAAIEEALDDYLGGDNVR